MDQIKTAFSIYDASAGSGKTFTLVKEYLKIILQSKKLDAYRNILAITFTNKAVHEMKSRVVDSLSEFTKEKPNKKAQQLLEVLEIETGLSATKIREKSQQIIKNLIHNYAAFDISTIDKFTHKVIRAFAHDLNLPITFEVSLDTESLLSEAVDAIIAQAGNNAELTSLLVDFTMEKTDDDKSWDVSREILETGRLILNENYREEISHLNEKTIPDFQKSKENLKTATEALLEETKLAAKVILDLVETKEMNPKSFSGGFFINHLNKIAGGISVEGNKKYLTTEDIKINKTAKDFDLIEESIPNFLTHLVGVYSKLATRNFYLAFLKQITPLSLLNTLNVELKKIQKEQGILSIAEFNSLIYDQIQNQPAPFIYERLGEKYRHFFIDEFQDTSQMQWHNLIPLIANALSSENSQGEQGSLLLVGDPKQSIYRWRGGKAEQFIALSKGQNPFPNILPSHFSLETNWRSYSQVIQFNNDFFAFLSSKFKNSNYEDLYKNHSKQFENNKKGGLVNIRFIPKIEQEKDESEETLEKQDLYLQATKETIQKICSNGFAYKDVVILTRKKAHGTAIAMYLTENKIPIVSSESLLLSQSSEVLVCINILRYINNKKDTESKVNFLYYLAKNNLETNGIHDFILEGRLLEIESQFELWLCQQDISFSFESLRRKPLYETVEVIIAKIIPLQKRNAYLQFFLDLVLEQDIKKQSGISDFLTYWNSHAEKLSIPSPEGNNAIRIMTIHKSKGLEFPVVIFPFAEEDYSRSPKDKIWLDADEQTVGLNKVLVSSSKAIETFGDDAKAVYLQKEEEILLDNVNILYVALTRAEEQLFIISNYNHNKNGLPNNMSSFFVEFLGSDFTEEKLEYEFGETIRLSDKEKPKEKAQLVPQLAETLLPKNIKIAQRESVMWNTKQQQAIEYGNTIHEILSYIISQEDLQNAIQKAIENGLITENQKSEISQTINDIVAHSEISSFFQKDKIAYNEKAILLKNGNSIKPDRVVFESETVVALLDYKTGQFLPKHKIQLENYQIALEEMGFKVNKKTLLYIGEEMEIVNL
jgi:ATP-dependent exoDNAse (exonuclease V) beta subunit